MIMHWQFSFVDVVEALQYIPSARLTLGKVNIIEN